MDRETKTFVIPNEQCRTAGITATWLTIDQLSIRAFEKRNIKQPDIPSHFASTIPSSIFHLRQEVILFHPILRKLVNESCGVFLAVQNLMVNKNAAEYKVELFKMSRQYRSIIRACLENLQDDLNKAEEYEKEQLQNYITIFYSVECIWHLCEILFVDIIPGNLILSQLLEWIRFHFPKHERNAASMLSSESVGLETHEDYWNTVFGSLLQGRVKVVRALLRQHSSADDPTFKLVDQVLRAMPTCSGVNGASINEFNMQWKHWAIDVQSKIDAKLFSTQKHLDLIMRLVIGEEKAWAEVQERCEAWYEFLAGWLFYTEPTAKSFELGQYAKRSITKMKVANSLKHLDRVILAAMEFDIFQVIKEIQHMTENGWFVAHLSDLLYHSSRLTSLEKEVPNFSAEKLRESFILDYGITMMGHKSLWQVGLSYLDHCTHDGTQVIALLLPRIQSDNESKTLKIIREAKKRDLNDVVQCICKVQGMLSLRRGRIGNALCWALKSQDGPFTSYLADKFLQDYIKSGKLGSTDLLDNLGSCMLVSDRLIFLGKYFEFHKLYQSQKYKEAANLLVSLLASKIIPKYFWYVLLTDAIPLLESEELLFSSNDTYTIIHCTEQKEDLPEMKDKLNILKLAAARNLARALTYEAQNE
nr:unnamed protein product [Callosobruchus chinensis]